MVSAAPTPTHQTSRGEPPTGICRPPGTLKRGIHRAGKNGSAAHGGLPLTVVKVPAGDFEAHQWSGSTIEYHRGQIRSHLGSVADGEKLTLWLTAGVARAERNPDRVRDELLKRLREEFIEPPAPDRVTRMVRSALHQAEDNWFRTVWGRVAEPARSRALALTGEDPTGPGQAAASNDEDDSDTDESVLALVKSMPGNVSLESMLREIRKLQAIRAVGLPTGLCRGHRAQGSRGLAGSGRWWNRPPICAAGPGRRG